MKQRMMDRSLVSLALKEQGVWNTKAQDKHEGQMPYSLHPIEFWFTTNPDSDPASPSKKNQRERQYGFVHCPPSSSHIQPSRKLNCCSAVNSCKK